MNINFISVAQNTKLVIWLGALVFCMLLVSILGIAFAPLDYLQGVHAKIMYIHVPAAWLSLGVFAFIASSSGLFIITKNPQWEMVANYSAPIGLIYTFIALVTGSLWGKPTWGAFWVWDARLTSMLMEFFIYLIYIILSNMNYHKMRRAYITSYFAMVSAINIPIIKFSVYLWNTLHQKSSVVTTQGPKIDFAMLWPLLSNAVTLFLFTCLIVLIKVRIASYQRKERRFVTKDHNNI